MCKFCGKNDIPDNIKLKNILSLEQANARRGLLCAVKFDNVIDGFKVYCLSDYDFLDCDTPPTVHENLWNQAKLNMNYGLFLVSTEKKDGEDTPHLLAEDEKYPVQAGNVFQIRGYDLASMTLVYDGSGWIVMDVLTTSEQAKAVWENIVAKHFDSTTVNTVIYSHSHIDHYGGIGGLKDYFDKDCEILAPEGFTKYAVSENIYVGTAMKRRAVYQYGTRLPISATGCVDCGLGKAVSKGTNTLIMPTREIGFGHYLEDKKYCAYNASKRKILTAAEAQSAGAFGDLILQMQYTPGTEAPAEMNVYLPGQKILFIAENCAGTLHNILTPRGAEVRDPLAWANFLDETLVTFFDLEIVCSAHNWPHFGHENSVHFIEIQRDMYRYINNATLHLINLGYTIDEVGRMISGEDGSMPLPEDFANEWCCHGFYGTYNHDAKAVYQRYMGWYDGNPAHLNRHKPTDRATKYIAAFGADAILRTAKSANENHDYEWAAELLDYILNADRTWICGPLMEQAKQTYAEALRQMGYRSESPAWRNMYLTGAQEVLPPSHPCTAAAAEIPYLKFDDDTVKAMTLEMILQYMGIMLDSKSFKEKYQSDSLTMKIIVKENDKVKECAKVSVKAGRGVLDYRIVSEEVPKNPSEICVTGTKLSIFHAFVDHDTDELHDLISVEQERDIVGDFINNCLTRFPLNFPIMTPRKKY